MNVFQIPRRRLCELLLSAAIAISALGCTTAGAGRSPGYLIIERLEGASGAEPEEFGTVLFADVQTIVERQMAGDTVRVATVFADAGLVTFRLGLKDPGTPTSPLTPSSLNEITVTRYRVQFKRADGRNTPGVDIPYGFDGAITVTVPAGGSASAGFELVRHQMKQEPPIANLLRNGGAILISTIADVTFWGHDQAGNAVTVSGAITVNFGDFGDPS